MRKVSVWVYAIGFALLLVLPYIVGILNTPDGWQFSGAVPSPNGFRTDYNSHLAKMWQGARGEWDYQLLFTHEAHPGLYFVQGFYVALGAVAGLVSLDFALVYHAVRFLLIVGMSIAIWKFAAHFFQRDRDCWLVLIFGTLVSGWGWIVFLAAPHLLNNQPPIAFWLLDAFNGLGALYMPHFVAAILLQIVAVLLFERWRTQPNLHDIALLTLVLLLDAFIQPYIVLLTIPLFGLLTAYHLFINQQILFRQALWLLIPAGVHGGAVVYQFLVISGDPVWAEFTAQNQTLSPAPIFYLLGYAPFALPFVFGGRTLWSQLRKQPRWLVPLVWVIIVIVLLYAPFQTQRRYLLGVQTPLAVLAAFGWIHSIGRWRGEKLLLAPYIGLSSVALLVMIAGNASLLTNPRSHASVYYTGDERAAYAWVRENTATDALFLTAHDVTIYGENERGSGGALVAATGRRVFLGHWIETINFAEKQQQIDRFYAEDTSDVWRRNLLQSIGADYVWVSPEARNLGNWLPEGISYLTPVFQNDSITIYEVQL